VVVLSPGQKLGGNAPMQAQAVAKAARTVAVSAAAMADEDDGLGAMHELAELAKAVPSASNAVYCPQCRTAMDDKAVLCTNCGYDTRTGKSLAVANIPAESRASAKSLKKTGKAVDYMAPDGSLILGVIFSAVFALAASLVWIAVAWLTGFAIGYIAILIGAAAGVGMQIGHKGYSKTGGYIASAMTIFAIIVAKIVVLEAIIAHEGKHVSIFDLDRAKMGYYFFNPIGLIIIAVGIGAAYRTANGSSSK
jgi:hypothetical protein